ncbi:MAG: type 4a pilus biogenesis protein PilO [Deltaproteobacteria bacterium]|nr:type 4a pilus biogenesis protein PilO [Deltaproteobacteria bacterium]
MKKIDLSKISKITEPLFQAMDKIGKLSKLYRLLISLGIICLFAGPIVYFLYIPNWEKEKELNVKYEKLEQKLARFKAKARKLRALRKQFKDAENEFKIVMKALPEKKEIPNLLESISSSGQDSGLEFTLFEPKPVRNKDFYAEIPVSINVSGSYHNVAMFFDKVSRLPRIVNIDNISITAQKNTKKGLSLATSCTAVTYRFIEKKRKKKKKKK